MELSGLTRHVLVWYLIVLSLVSFQAKLTSTLPDHEAPGNLIEATLSGLLCVRHSVSHFVSTGTNDPTAPDASSNRLVDKKKTFGCLLPLKGL